MIAAIVDELAANLVARNSIGHIGAAQLLLTAGDNPERLRSEASFASLCGVSPVPASSGKTVRHWLNRGGDRAANSALHIIAIGRLFASCKQIKRDRLVGPRRQHGLRSNCEPGKLKQAIQWPLSAIGRRRRCTPFFEANPGSAIVRRRCSAVV